jgi:hypothetical protein
MDIASAAARLALQQSKRVSANSESSGQLDKLPGELASYPQGKLDITAARARLRRWVGPCFRRHAVVNLATSAESELRRRQPRHRPHPRTQICDTRPLY